MNKKNNTTETVTTETVTTVQPNPNAIIDFDLTANVQDIIEDKRITANRDKISTVELITKYPDGITVNQVELRNKDDAEKRYIILVFDEDETKFYCGGAKFCEFFRDLNIICRQHGCNIHDYLYQKPIKIKIGLKTSRNGREYVTLEPAK